MVHGLGCDGSDWDLPASIIAAQARCLVPDLRGHGLSPPLGSDASIESLAADVVAVAGRRHADEFLVAGHSLGARVALEIFIRHPRRVIGLVLVDGSSVPGDPDVERSIHAREIARTGFDAYVEDLYDTMLLDGLAPDTRAMIKARAKRMDPAAVIELFAAMAMWDRDTFAAAVDAVSVPTWACQSTSILPAPGERRVPIARCRSSRWLDALRKNPHVAVAEIESCGHFVTWERAGCVASAIRDLLARPPHRHRLA
jgi:pimeloyl-ACP methyl ester carboxylesterase